MCLRRLRRVEDRVHAAHRRHCPSPLRYRYRRRTGQDALLTALELWPEQGIPENPGAWLMTAAKRRAIDNHGADRVGILAVAGEMVRLGIGDGLRLRDLAGAGPAQPQLGMACTKALGTLHERPANGSEPRSHTASARHTPQLQVPLVTIATAVKPGDFTNRATRTSNPVQWCESCSGASRIS